LAVYFNEKRVPVKKFRDYIGLYIKQLELAQPADKPLKVCYEKINDKQGRRRYALLSFALI